MLVFNIIAGNGLLPYRRLPYRMLHERRQCQQHVHGQHGLLSGRASSQSRDLTAAQQTHSRVQDLHPE